MERAIIFLFLFTVNLFAQTPSYSPRYIGSANSLTNNPGLIGQTNRTIYVDQKTGSDSTGNGTQEKPFATIGYQFSDAEGSSLFFKTGALSVARSGDTIRLMPGDYTNEVVQLWLTNASGISLIGSGQTSTRIFSPGNLSGGSQGENIIQLGNNSVVSDLSVYGTTNFAKTIWYNPIGNSVNTSFATLYWYDAMNDGNAPPNLQIFSCTNAFVKNVYGWGAYDGVFLAGRANYSIVFSHCSFEGFWDLCALYGYNSNTVQTTEWQDCIFFAAGGGASASGRVEACDLHGGYHTFKDCTFIAKDGSNVVSWPLRLGMTIGIFAEDGHDLAQQTNRATFYNCNVHAYSTNTSGIFSLTNYSSAAGKSVIKFLGGSLHTLKATNWLGATWDTNLFSFVQRGATGGSVLDGQGGAQFDAGITVANSSGASTAFTITSGGDVVSGINTVMSAGGSFVIPSGQTLDLGGSAEFTGVDGAFSGPVSWDAAGNFSATSLSGNGSQLTALTNTVGITTNISAVFTTPSGTFTMFFTNGLLKKFQ